LGDHASRRKPLFISAIVIQWAGISLIMIGTHLGLWISGVILYGAASAIVWSTSLALIIDRFPADKLGQALSFTGLSLSIGVLLGPALGGIIYQKAGHYAVWSTVLGVTVLDFLLRIFLVEPPRVKITKEGPKVSPLVALQLLRSPRMLVALFGACIQAAILTSFDASLTIYVARTFHWESLQAGLLWLAFCLPAFASPLVGMLGDRFGVRVVMTLAFAAAAPILAVMQLVTKDSTGDKVLLCALLALLGSLLGTTISLFSAEVGHVVYAMAEQRPGLWGERGVFAQAEGIWWAAYMLGMAIGPLIGGFVLGSAGWSALSWVLAALSVFASMLVVAFMRS
jgi:MFS family permease